MVRFLLEVIIGLFTMNEEAYEQAVEQGLEDFQDLIALFFEQLR